MWQNIHIACYKILQSIQDCCKMQQNVFQYMPYTIYLIPSSITNYHVPYVLYHISFTICHLRYAIYHLLYAIYHIPYSIYHLPCDIAVTCNVPSTKFHLRSSTVPLWLVTNGYQLLVLFPVPSSRYPQLLYFLLRQSHPLFSNLD